MFSTDSEPNKVLTGVAAALIAVVLAGGIVGVVANSGGGKSAAQKQAEAQAQAQKQAADAQKRQAEADKKALDLITANQDACNNKFLPNANARADQALKDLNEQRAALEAIAAELPAGKAKDTLSEQIGPGYDSGEALIKSELRAATTDCQLAFTVYQLTREPPSTEGG